MLSRFRTSLKNILPRSKKIKMVLFALLFAVMGQTAIWQMGERGWTRSINNIYYDYWHILVGKRHEAQYSALITVDPPTLAMFKKDPVAFWGPHFGKAVEVLSNAGVTAIGLDYIYRVSAEEWLRTLKLPDDSATRDYDSTFRGALAGGRMVLISQLVGENDEIEAMLPPDEHLLMLPNGIFDTGVANLYPDHDWLVRHFYPIVIPDVGFPGYSFPWQLAMRQASSTAPANMDKGLSWTLKGKEYRRERLAHVIGYIGPPGSVMRVSMSKLFAENALDDPEVKALKGRAVIIADDFSGTSDKHFSPYSRPNFIKDYAPMPGAEIHTNIIETLLSGQAPVFASENITLFVNMLCFFGLAVIFLRYHPAVGFLWLALTAIVIMVPSYFLFKVFLWFYPIGDTQLGLLFIYVASIVYRLTGEERMRIKLRQSFGQYVSDVVADRIADSSDDSMLKGEKVPVTVLFTDIRNFTTISEMLSPQEVVEMLNEYFARACEPILREEGMVNKFIGDAIMAIFGGPTGHKDHAIRAVRAALDIAVEADKFRQWMAERFPNRPLPIFGIGVGIHTGEVVMGDIGTQKRREFTAIGDTVNLASRLEGITKEMHVVVVASEATVNAIGPMVRCGISHQTRVKGREEAVKVYQIIGLAQ